MPTLLFQYRFIDDLNRSNELACRQDCAWPHPTWWPRYGRYEILKVLDATLRRLPATDLDSRLSPDHRHITIGEDHVTLAILAFTVSETVTYCILRKAIQNLYRVISLYGAFTSEINAYVQGQVVAHFEM